MTATTKPETKTRDRYGNRFDYGGAICGNVEHVEVTVDCPICGVRGEEVVVAAALDVDADGVVRCSECGEDYGVDGVAL
jgi:transcription elongation factor Elf1